MVFYIVWLDVYASLFHSQFILFAIKIQELQHKNSEQETAGINDRVLKRSNILYTVAKTLFLVLCTFYLFICRLTMFIKLFNYITMYVLRASAYHLTQLRRTS